MNGRVVLLGVFVLFTNVVCSQSDQFNKIDSAFKEKKYEDVIKIYGNNVLEEEPMQLKINMMVGEAACKTQRWKSGRSMYNHILKYYKVYLPDDYIGSLRQLKKQCKPKINTSEGSLLTTNEMMLFKFIVANEPNSRGQLQGFRNDIDPLMNTTSFQDQRQSVRDREKALIKWELAEEERRKAEENFIRISGRRIKTPPIIKKQ